jgi:hypothetical protein
MLVYQNELQIELNRPLDSEVSYACHGGNPELKLG